MPVWGWVATVAVGVALGALAGFGFAAWLIGMNQRDELARWQQARDQAPPDA